MALEAARYHTADAWLNHLPDETDVLVVGAGPVGLIPASSGIGTPPTA
jgi:ribulose 1,5-bisphosphate synthetase/thiazole synthase